MTISTSRLLLLILLGALCTLPFGVRVSSKSKVQYSLDSSLESTTSTMALNSITTTWMSCTNPTQDTAWTYSPKFSTITCSGNKYVGPYGSGGSIKSPVFSVGTHKGIIVSFKLALIDSWDTETFKITADGALVYSRTHWHSEGTSDTCQNKWNDVYETVTFGFNHTASTLVLIISSTLDSASTDEAWGICDVAVTVSPYQVTTAGAALLTTEGITTTTWFACSAPANEFGWTYSAGYNKITCGGNTFVGPYGSGATLKSPILTLSAHQGVIVSFKLALIDSWDSETFKITADGTLVYSRTHWHSEGTSDTCQNKWNDVYETVTFGFNHTASTLSLIISSTLDSASTDEAWGICDVAVTVSPYQVTTAGAALLTTEGITTTTWFACSAPANEFGWTYSAGYTKITCGGNTFVGPYGSGATLKSPMFSIGAHKGIIVSFKLALIDSWDTETFKITADGILVYSRTHWHSEGTSDTCQNKWNDVYETVTFGFNHTASTLVLIISSTLDSASTDEAWGICDVAVTVSPYQVTTAGAALVRTEGITTTTWFACSAPANEFGWTYSAGYNKITCGGNTFVGPYGSGATLKSPILTLSAHQGVIVSFKLALIDSWDTETFKITADGALVYSRTHSHGTQGTSNTCQSQWPDIYEDVTFGFNHTASTLTFAISSTLNQDPSDEAWGICGFAVIISPNPVTSNGNVITTTTSASPTTPVAGTSSGSSMKGVFPNEMNLGCVNIHTIAGVFKNALTYFSGANSATKSIIDTTVNTVVNGLLNYNKTKPIASTGACLGNFAGSYITSNIGECSSMLLPDNAEYSVLSFNVPIPGGVCAAQPALTTAAFCVAMGISNGLPSVSIQANSGALSCIATAAGSGVGYAIATAVNAGLDKVSLGVSLTASFEKSTTIFTGKVENAHINGNYYDYVRLALDSKKYGLPDVLLISGSATRVVKVVDNAATWVSKLSSASNVNDVATTLFGDLSFLAAIEADVTLALASKTFGLLPNLGPYQLGLGTLYATSFPTTLPSGQTLKTGVYTYFAANNVLPKMIADIMGALINKVGGVLNTILKDFGISISDIIKKLTPSASIASNVFGFMINTDEIGLLVQTSMAALTTIIPDKSKISVQCTFKYSGSKFSCKMHFGSVSKFFTGLLSGATWVIKEAKEFFDETGKAIAFAEKQLAAFTDKALQTTANNIEKGATVVAGYTTDAANWAAKAVYQCGYQTVADAVKCGADRVTDAAKCGSSWVTSGAKCGYKTVTDAAICGYDTITDGAKCGYDTIVGCIVNIFSGKSCKKPKSCKVPSSCKIEASCNFPNTCDFPRTCNIPNNC